MAMDEKFNVKQNINGDDNVQINSEGDTIAAIGDGSIAAGGNITINNIKGVDPEIHAQALKKIDELEHEVERLKANENPTNQQSQSRKVMEKASKLEEFADVDYSIHYLHKLGFASLNIGEYDKSEKYYLQSISKAKDLGSKTILSWGYNGLSILENTRGNLDRAREYSNLISNDNPILEASNMGNQGIIECRSGNYHRGNELFQAALTIFEQENDLQGIANSLNSLGNVAKKYQNNTLAEEYFTRSMEIKQHLGDLLGVCNSLFNIGSVLRMRKEHSEALSAYSHCLQIAEENNWLPLTADINGNIGNVYLDLGTYQKASHHHNLALETHRLLGDEIGIGLCKQNLASLAQKMNDLNLAEKLFTESAEILHRNNSEHLHNTLLGLEEVRESLRQNKSNSE